jgi:formylglycine-generating enzyme required for sulfatase activity
MVAFRAMRCRDAAVVLAVALVSFAGFAAGCELAVKLDHFDDGCPPRGLPGVRIHTSGGTYCIDTTEVTVGQYTEFFNAVQPAPQTAAHPMGCETVTDFTPTQGWPPAPGMEIYPITQVNWCQAYAYCAWVGKRLCGRIGGGSLASDTTSEKDPTLSQWFNACTGGGATAYPYGATFDENACGGQGPASNSFLLPAGRRATCVGGYPGIEDMSGNVWEWTDTCDGTNFATSKCHAYGGAYDATPNELACNSFRPWNINSAAGNIGVRCCADIPDP